MSLGAQRATEHTSAAASGEENYVEVPDSLPETSVLHSNEETTEDADDAAINNGAVEAIPHIPAGLEVAEATEPETTARTTTTTTEPTTTTVATSTVPMSKCCGGGSAPAADVSLWVLMCVRK